MNILKRILNFYLVTVLVGLIVQVAGYAAKRIRGLWAGVVELDALAERLERRVRETGDLLDETADRLASLRADSDATFGDLAELLDESTAKIEQFREIEESDDAEWHLDS